jgi:hypothetical protein
MGRVDTASIATQMVTLQFLWQSLYKKLVNKAMGEKGEPGNRPFLVRELSVSIPIPACRPFPTRDSVMEVFARNFNFGKDAGEKFAGDDARINDSHSISLTDVVVRLGGVLTAPFRAISIVTRRVYA